MLSHNAERKAEFIASLPPKSKIPTVRVAFDTLSKYEEKFHKDICDFTVDEIREAYIGMEEYNAEYLYRINRMMRKYTDWCIQNKLTNTDNSYNTFTIDELLDCVAADDFISPQRVREWAYRFSENPMDAFLIAAPFYGLSSKNGYAEYILTRDNIQVNEESAVLKLPSRELVVPVYVADYALRAIDATEYTIHSINAIHPFIPSDYVIKFVQKSTNTKRNVGTLIANKYARLFKQALHDKNLTPKKLAKSGMVYFARKIMLQYGTRRIEDVYGTPEFQKDVIERFCLSKSTYTIYFFTRLINKDSE